MSESGAAQQKGELQVGRSIRLRPDTLHRGYAGQGDRADGNYKHTGGFSLLELLVVMTIVGMWMAILLPASIGVRKDAQAVLCMDNQRKIVLGAISFAADNECRYPESVATIGETGDYWNWQEPTMLTSCRQRDQHLHRSVSAYLRSYIPQVSIMFCPGAPEKYKYLQQAWEAGDEWDNPKTPPEQDPVMGTYCFYWNYTGFLEGRDVPFRGPQSLGRERGESSLMVSDYFGYGHWRNRLIYGDCRAYGSCERFKGAIVTPGTWVSSAYWSCRGGDEKSGLETLKIKLHAGYADGHVERYTAAEVIPMRVSQTSDGSVPYPRDLGPGVFYLPEDALR